MEVLTSAGGSLTTGQRRVAWTRRFVVVVGFMCSTVLVAEGHTPRATIRDQTDVEIANLTVHASHQGFPVEGLAREDFEIRLDGKRMEIHGFSEVRTGESTLLVVCFDNLYIPTKLRKKFLRELHGFLEQRARKGYPTSIVRLEEFKGRRPEVQASMGPTLADLEGALQTKSNSKFQVASPGIDGTGARRGERQAENHQFDVEVKQHEFDDISQRILQLARMASTFDGFSRVGILYLGGNMNRALVKSEEYSSVVQNEESLGSSVGSRMSDGTFRGPSSDGFNFTAYTETEFNREFLRLPEAELARLGEQLSRRQIALFTLQNADEIEGLANASGGLVLRRGQIASDLEMLESHLEHSYSLAYILPKSKRPAGDKAWKVKVKVESRSKIELSYPQSILPRHPDQDLADRLLAVMTSKDPVLDLPVEAKLGDAERFDRSLWRVTVRLRIPMRELTFLPLGEDQMAQLSVAVVIRDPKSRLSPLRKAEVPIEVPAGHLDSARGQDYVYDLHLLFKKGDNLVALALHDDFGDRQSILVREVEVLGQH